MKKFLVIVLLIGAYIFTRQKMNSEIQTALKDKNVIAFLAMIRASESHGDYFILYGGSHFSDMSKHPDIKIPFFNPATGKEDYSTAAGAYQINYPTWLVIQAAAFLPDFSPASQDEAAVWLLKLRGALPDIMAGNFDAALQIASKTWASLPYSTAGQNPVKFAVAQNRYVSYGGTIA